MKKLLKIGIVGCGAIGTSLAKSIVGDFKGKAVVAALFDIEQQKAEKLSEAIVKNRKLSLKNLEEVIKKVDVVVECACASACADIAAKVLSAGRDIVVMSVGGIVDSFRKLSALAARHGGRMYIPSGAVAGIDALKAARISGLKRVVLLTRKHPLSFRGVGYVQEKGIRLAGLKHDMTLFSGPAHQAIKHFPQNINVAATLSLAGIGEKKTRVKIIASPGIKRNIHEIQIESRAGVILARTENIVHPHNPKTSYLAVLSAVALLKEIVEPVTIGT